MFEAGKGVPQDYAEAMKWHHMAAERGKADAQNNLGVLYLRGNGVPRDYVQAHK
jgi:TPR repeat protein